MNQISSLLKFIGNKIAKYDTIQGGTLSIGTVPSKGYVDLSVTFPKAFSSPPIVSVSLNSSSTSSDIGMMTVGTMTSTNTGFTVRCFNASSVDRSPGGALDSCSCRLSKERRCVA